MLSFASMGQHNKWVEPARVDTTIQLSETVSAKLTPHKAIQPDKYYLPYRLIDSLTAAQDNYYRKAIAIEKYQIRNLAGRVRREGNKLAVKLTSGKWRNLKDDPDLEEVWYTFEHYFQEHGFYSVRVQHAEGHKYILVNADNGEITSLIGRPYFSPDGTRLIALGNDIEAGYSENGFQLLRNLNGKLTETGKYDPETWGCKSASWLNQNTLVLENESIEFIDSEMKYFSFFTRLDIL